MMSTTRITHLSLPLISLVRAHELAVQSVLEREFGSPSFEPASRHCADLRFTSPKRAFVRPVPSAVESRSAGSELNTSKAQKVHPMSRARRARAAARAAPARAFRGPPRRPAYCMGLSGCGRRARARGRRRARALARTATLVATPRSHRPATADSILKNQGQKNTIRRRYGG